MNPFFLPAGSESMAAVQPPQVPSAPKLGSSPLPQAVASPLPAAPPRRRGQGLWDEGNRSQTLLAIGAGLLSGPNFSDGMANASRNLMGLQDHLDTQNRQLHEYGGPDGAFEITTDPRSGEQSVREVPQFRDYLDHRRVKPRDTADLNGRAMYALSQLPEADRPAAYAAMRANPDQFGVDPSNMPEAYDPSYVGITANMGMTVAQATHRDQAAVEGESRDRGRRAAAEDRAARTDIYRARSTAATAQGEARIGIARARTLPKAPPASRFKAHEGLDPRYEFRRLPDGRVQQRLKR